MSTKQNNLTRREFLQTGALASVAVGMMPRMQDPQEKKKQEIDTKKILNYNPEMKYNQLGETGIFFSVISLGGLGLERAVAHYAIDHGVNLVHMSTTYNGGRSIKELGAVLKEKRDKVYIALKDSFYHGSVDDINTALKILNTDYVDFLMFNRHKKSKVNDKKIFENFEKWRQQGKVRFAGLTTHKHVKACVGAALESHFYSLIMPVLNQPNLEAMTEEMREAKEKGIGIMAMKTLKGIKKPELQIAYLKKVLRNPAVTTVNKGFPTFELFDNFMKAMKETLTSQEDFSLYRYAQQNRSENCMMCAECEHACPKNIEISTMLRSKTYYFDELQDLQTAKSTFQEIPPHRRYYARCNSCRKCEQVCPNGIPIVDKLEKANRFFERV